MTHPIDAQIKLLSTLFKLTNGMGQAITEMNWDKAISIAAFELVLAAGLKHHLDLDPQKIKQAAQAALDESFAALDAMDAERKASEHKDEN